MGNINPLVELINKPLSELTVGDFYNLTKSVLQSEVPTLVKALLPKDTTQANSRAAEDDAPMSVEQAAEFLHYKPDTVRKKAKKGEIPCKRSGRFYLFNKKQLLEYLNSSASVTQEEIRSSAEAYIIQNRR